MPARARGRTQQAKSRRLLEKIEEMRQLEQEKREAARSTPEFHALADRVDEASAAVFGIAHEQLVEGEEDSPIEAERKEQHAGDWTEASRL